MYIVRHRKTKRILHVDKSPLSKKLKPRELYPSFDKSVMELLKTDLPKLPQHFTVDRNGLVKPMTLEQQVEAGVRKLLPHQKIKGNAIVPKTLREKVESGVLVLDAPFEHINSKGKRVKRSASQLIKSKLLTTDAQVDRVLAMIAKDTLAAIEQVYPIRNELRITKDFSLWMYEGRPADDEREQEMLNMEAYIHSVRAEAESLKAAANELRPGGAKKRPKAVAKPRAKAPAKNAAAIAKTEEAQPDEYWTVARLRTWMTDRNIAFVNRDKKPELLDKIKAARS